MIKIIENPLSDHAIISIILDITSLIILSGLLIYSSLFRKRGRLEDKLFFAALVTNFILAVTDSLSYISEGSHLIAARDLIYLESTLSYAAYAIFPYLFLILLYCSFQGEKKHLSSNDLILGIPCFIFLVILLFNFRTRWIFYIDNNNIWKAGSVPELIFVPVLFYYFLVTIRMLKINRHHVLLLIIILAFGVMSDMLFNGVSSTAFVFAMFLTCTHINVMNRPLSEEELWIS